MAWIKLDDQLPLNTKMRALSVEGRYLFVTSLCWCAMQMNDGTFPASDTPSIAVLAGVPQSVAEQLSPTLWHTEGTDCGPCAEVGQAMPVPSGHITVHCYLERNESRAQVENRRRQDRQRKAGSVRNPPGIQRESGRNPSVSSRPVPSTSDLDSRRPGNSRANGTRPDDDDLSTGLVPEAVWTRYAELRLAGKTDVRDPVPWKRTCAANARSELGEQAADWWTTFDLDANRLAQALIDGQPPRYATRRSTNGDSPT